MTFNPSEAAAMVDADLAALAERQRERVQEEYEDAVETAAKYAEHLAAGGDPRKYEEPPLRANESRWSRSRLVPYKSALDAVYDRYRETQGTDANPYSPIHYAKRWSVARYALAHIGEPMAYADLGAIGGSMAKMPSGEVAQILANLQWTNGRDLVLRRVRIDGKVGYLLRSRGADEQPFAVDWKRDEETGFLSHSVDPAMVPLEPKRKAVVS
jgi:hypothetical protein